MEAITLSYDRNHPLSQLMVETYRDFWPDHPFSFRVPYNEEYREWLDEYEEVQPIKARVHFRDTMNDLLEGIDDNKFVYWASDDRYLYKQVDADALSEVIDFVEEAPEWLDEVRLTAHVGIGVGPMYFKLGDIKFYNQISHKQYGFWMHHFIRAGVLRGHFNDNLEDNYPLFAIAKKMGEESMTENILVPERAVIMLAEPLRRGVLTRNAIDEMKRRGIEPPEHSRITGRIVYGKQGETIWKPL